MTISVIKEYRKKLVGMLTDKEYEIYDAQVSGSNVQYVNLKRREKKALEYAINLIDRELLEQESE